MKLWKMNVHFCKTFNYLLNDRKDIDLLVCHIAPRMNHMERFKFSELTSISVDDGPHEDNLDFATHHYIDVELVF